MKKALDKEGLSPYLMTQPNGFLTPDAPVYGWLGLPEYPFGKIFYHYVCNKFIIHIFCKLSLNKL